jgi:hypothetical protein
MPSYLVDGYEFVAPSRRKGKKYDVYRGGRYLLSFGALGYEHFRDVIGHYRNQDHGDPRRRKSYLNRHHPGAKTREDALAETPKTSAKYFSTKYLW